MSGTGLARRCPGLAAAPGRRQPHRTYTSARPPALRGLAREVARRGFLQRLRRDLHRTDLAVLVAEQPRELLQALLRLGGERHLERLLQRGLLGRPERLPRPGSSRSQTVRASLATPNAPAE